MNRRELLEYEQKRDQWQLSRELAALAKTAELQAFQEANIAALRARIALRGDDLLKMKASRASNAQPSQGDRYESAELLFWETLRRRPLREALRQLFKDSSPAYYDRESIFSLVTFVSPDAKEGTVYSTLSRLVREGVVEKHNAGYRGTPEKFAVNSKGKL